MGTRHLICVQKNKQYKVAQYGQWDGYPTSCGVNILEFLRRSWIRDKFAAAIDRCTFLSLKEARDIERELDVDSKLLETKYRHLSRDTSYRILAMIQGGGGLALQDSLEFAGDSLMCEWAYCIDLDKNVLEVFKGFNKTKLLPNERFFGIKEPERRNLAYHGVRYVTGYSLEYPPGDDEMQKIEVATGAEDESQSEET